MSKANQAVVLQRTLIHGTKLSKTHFGSKLYRGFCFCPCLNTRLWRPVWIYWPKFTYQDDNTLVSKVKSMSGTLSFEYQVILICLLFLRLFELLSAPKRSFAIVYLKTNHESWNTGNWELTVSLQLNIFRKKICTRYLCTFLLIWRLVFTWVLLGTKLKDSTILALVLLYYHKTRRFWKPKKDTVDLEVIKQLYHC